MSQIISQTAASQTADQTLDQAANQTAIATKRVFICGSALRGQPDHTNLGDAKFL